jgi:nucleotide-binding universal stress UspA family protein
VRAPVAIGAAIALEYRRIVVPIFDDEVSFEAMDVACRLAADRRSTVVAVTAIEVPLDHPLEEVDAEAERHANKLLDRARATGELYGVRTVTRVERTRNAGSAFVREAKFRQAEIIVVGAARRDRGAIFERQVDFVLKHAPCRVMVAAPAPVATGVAPRRPLAVDRNEKRDDQDRDDIGDLDHRVDRGAGGVLVRVADGIARHRGRMGF